MNIDKSSLKTTILASLLGAVAFLAGAAAQAQTMTNGGWVNGGLVTRMHPGDAGGFFYFSTATQYGASSCQQNTFGYAVDTTLPSASRQYATLLTAYALGKPVWIHLTAGCSAGTLRPLVDTIEITDVGYQ